MDEVKPDPPAAHVGNLHQWDARGVCTTCCTTRTEALLLGPNCVFQDHPEAKKLVVPGDDDKPAGVVLYDESSGVGLPDPGDCLAWALAGAKLYTLAMKKLDQIKSEKGRDDLRHVLRWAVGPHGDELHVRLKVTLP